MCLHGACLGLISSCKDNKVGKAKTEKDQAELYQLLQAGELIKKR